MLLHFLELLIFMGHSVLLWLFLYVAFIKCIAYFVHFAFMDTFLLILRYSTFMSWPHTLFFAKSNIIAFDKLLFYVIKSYRDHIIIFRYGTKFWRDKIQFSFELKQDMLPFKKTANGVFLSTWKHDVAHKFFDMLTKTKS